MLEQFPLAVQVLTYVVAFNVILTGLKQGLDLIKDKTATQADNKLADFLGKIVGLLGKLVDAVGFNPKHPESK